MKETFLKYEHVFKCTFSRGKAGPRPLPGGVHVKIQMGMARPIFLGLKFGQVTGKTLSARKNIIGNITSGFLLEKILRGGGTFQK